jgi:hypothetical protein
MTAPGPTIKSFHKRLYTVLPRGVSVPRIRSNSAGASSRALHSYPSLPYGDPSTPPPSSRPGNPHLLSTTRLPIEARTEPEAPNSSQSQHAHTGPAPPSSLALTSPHSSNSSSSSLNGIPLSNFHAPPFFLYQPFTPPSSPPSAVLDSCSLPSNATASRHRFHFDVGAYGIPKRHSPSMDSGRDVSCDAEHWSHHLKLGDGLDLAVQVGEDAYFVRDNAMGVADGVGGWSRTSTSVLCFSHFGLFMPIFRIAERRPFSIGTFRSTLNALLFRRGRSTGILSRFLSRFAPVTEGLFFSSHALVLAISFSDAPRCLRRHYRGPCRWA